MSKKGKYKFKIEKTLIKSSLSLNKLYKEVTCIEKFNGKDNSFYEALMSLLKNNKIAIVGYDWSAHNVKGDAKEARIQAFKKEGVKFELIKKEQLDILIMLNHLENQSVEEAKENKIKLEKCFNKKFNQYQDQKQPYWENLKSKSNSMLLKEYITKLEKELSEYIDFKELSNNSLKFQKLTRDLDTYRAWIKEYPNATVWWLEYLSEEEMETHLEFIKLNINQGIKIPRQSDGKPVLSMPLIEAGDDIINFRNTPLIDKDSEWDLNTFLEKKGFLKPEIKEDERKSLFNKMLFFVNSHENYKFMRQCFSWALSDEEDSLEWFKILLNNLNSSYRNLQQTLSINKNLKKENIEL